jgi:acetylornithine deacetylase/succinyl-diaminopimelate desuccinylase-like protein
MKRWIAGWLLVTSCAMAQKPAAKTVEGADRALARNVLQTLIDTDTTHATGSTTATAEKMRSLLLQAGFPASDLTIAGPNPKRMNLVVRYRAKHSDAKPVLTIIHLDVVEADRNEWSVDPFVLTEKDGYFYGRGTQDVKSGDAAFVTSFILLKKAGFQPKRDLILALTADEEGGADNGVAWLLSHRRDLIDASEVINPDAGGLALRDGKPVEMDLEATEKTYADYDLTATGPGGHSSRPLPDNAIYTLTAALGRLARSPFPIELNPVTRAYYEAELKLSGPQRRMLISRLLARPLDTRAAQHLARDPSDNATLRTTCVATMLQAGEAVNALPGSASANVNCRILPGHSAEEVRQQLVEIVNDEQVTVTYKDEGGKLSPTAPSRATVKPPPPLDDVLKPLRTITEAMWPGTPIVPTMELGASDSTYTSSAGIPSYGLSGIGIDQDDDRAHGRDERLRVEAYYQGVEFTRRFLQALGEE